MTSEQNDMIDFVKIWIPFGGPRSEDILIRYGMLPAVFYRRLLELVDDVPESEHSELEQRFYRGMRLRLGV